MSKFINLTLTKKGQEMILSSNTNLNKRISFTDGALGSGKLLPSEIKNATTIKSLWLKIPLNTVRLIDKDNNYYLKAEIAFTNIGIVESKLMAELGIYAKFEEEENEFLFAYAVTDDHGETIPAEDIVLSSYLFSIYASISTDTKINQILSPEGFLTKEVIELLKESIRNIGFRKIRGTLTEGQKIIQLETGAELLPVSKRLILNIEGDIYFVDRDYTLNEKANTITLNDNFAFPEGTAYEIIDPLPPTYVKEQISKFIEEFKTLVNDSKVDFNKLTDEIYLEFETKVNLFYEELNTYIENHKEELKGNTGLSASEDWLEKNPGKTYFDYLEATKGTNGTSIIDWEVGTPDADGNKTAVIILDNGNRTNPITLPKGDTGEQGTKGDTGGTGEQGTNGADFVTLEFVRFDGEGNSIVKSKNSKGEAGHEILIKRGERGYTGGSVGDPQPPGNVPYGTIVEWAGQEPPEGWLYTNGGTIIKKNFPQMSSILETITNITEPYLHVGRLLLDPVYQNPLKDIVKTENYVARSISIGEGKNVEIRCPRAIWDLTLETGSIFRATYPAEKFLTPGNISKKTNGNPELSGIYTGFAGVDYIAEMIFTEPIFSTAITVNTTNLQKGAIATIDQDRFCPNRDATIKIEILYEQNGEWILGAKVSNKLDFIEYPQITNSSIAVFAQTFKSNKFRLKIAEESKEHYLSRGSFRNVKVFYLGDFSMFFNNVENIGYEEVLKLPEEKDNQERYKIIFVGQPLAPGGEAITLYNKRLEFAGEGEYKEAANQKIPYWAEGVTTKGIEQVKIGYKNFYNKETDTWSITKTHTNKEGYYYNKEGELKYMPKPNEYSLWNFNANNWEPNKQLKKEELEKYESELIELDLKKDKAIQLGLDSSIIIAKIENIKKQMEVLNGISN